MHHAFTRDFSFIAACSFLLERPAQQFCVAVSPGGGRPVSFHVAAGWKDDRPCLDARAALACCARLYGGVSSARGRWREDAAYAASSLSRRLPYAKAFILRTAFHDGGAIACTLHVTKYRAANDELRSLPLLRRRISGLQRRFPVNMFFSAARRQITHIGRQ